jgi:hypothetical protein
MNLDERIKAFTKLGEILRDSLQGNTGSYNTKINSLIDYQYHQNQWFTSENVRYALESIAQSLEEEKLRKWTERYSLLIKNGSPKRVGVIAAGNIPLAGFHDMLSVLISGNCLVCKTSSKDSELLVFIADLLCSIDKRFSGNIEFTNETLKNFDVIIATGSNNSSRYFEYYFGKYPNIIRKNRNSVAILEGAETAEEIELLGNDTFLYFGLGCRNVSKIFLPEGYDLSVFAESWNKYYSLVSHSKYSNNYDFNKAVFIVNREKYFDSGYFLMKVDQSISSPVSVINYEYYNSYEKLMHHIDTQKDRIQCIVSKHHVPFGKAQSPDLWDYADGIDTLDFLLKKNTAGIL